MRTSSRLLVPEAGFPVLESGDLPQAEAWTALQVLGSIDFDDDGAERLEALSVAPMYDD